jgi:hypothetical protein
MIQSIITSIKNEVFLFKDLEEIYNSDPIYKEEVTEEAKRLSFSYNVSFKSKYDSCKVGKFSEIVLRNFDVHPISYETISKYARPDWINKNTSIENAVKYHDLIDINGNIIEVKNWSKITTENKQTSFINNDTKIYNFSDYCFFFQKDYSKFWLNSVINLHSKLFLYQKNEERNSMLNLTYTKDKKTVTISDVQAKLIKQNPKLMIKISFNGTNKSVILKANDLKLHDSQFDNSKFFYFSEKRFI